MYKIFYDDGSTYTGNPENAPVFGVLVIVEDDKDYGRRMVHHFDYYCWDNRGDSMQWFPSDFTGLIDYLSSPGFKRVLIGRYVSDKLFTKIFTTALNDKDFKPITGINFPHNGMVG